MESTQKANIEKAGKKAPAAAKQTASKPADAKQQKHHTDGKDKQKSEDAAPTKEELIACATDMNNVMGLKPLINVKINPVAIARDIMKNAADINYSDYVNADKKAQLSDATKATLAKLGFKAPVNPEEPKAAKPAKKAKSTTQLKAEKKDKVKEEKKQKYTRYMAVATCIKKIGKKGMSFEDIQSKSDDIYVEHGGTSNTKTVNEIRFMLHGLVEFGVLRVEKADKKEVYHLISKEA